MRADVPAPGAGAASAPVLRVCLEDRDPPRSERVPQRGFDVDVMREVARQIGRRLEPVWIPSEASVTELEESSIPVRALQRGRCDALASVPGPDALGADAEAVALSRAYYGAGFEWVGAEAILPDLAQLRGRRVAVLSVSPAHQIAAALGMEWRAEVNATEQLRRLDEGRVEAALVFGPSLAPLGRTARADFVPPPALRWNFHIATRRREAGISLAAIDYAVAELLESGRIGELLLHHGLPVRLPFESTFTPERLLELRQSGGSGT